MLLERDLRYLEVQVRCFQDPRLRIAQRPMEQLAEEVGHEEAPRVASPWDAVDEPEPTVT